MGFVGKKSISSHPIGNPDPVNTMKDKINIIYTAMAIIIIITLIMVGVTTNLRIINITIARIKNLRIIKIITNTIITSLHIITIAIKMAIKNLHIIIIINTIIIIRIRNIRIKIIIIFIKDINLVITSTKVIRIKIISQGSKRQVWILLLKLNVIQLRFETWSQHQYHYQQGGYQNQQGYQNHQSYKPTQNYQNHESQHGYQKPNYSYTTTTVPPTYTPSTTAKGH